MKPRLGMMAFCLIVLMIGSNTWVQTHARDVTVRKFDEFSGANWEDGMAHLDNFALSLQNESAATGIIFVYGGQSRRRFETVAWSVCVKDYLVNRRGIEATRLVVVLGGYRKKLTVELWESGKNNIPKAEPTIKRSDVKFVGQDIKQWQTLCAL